MSPRVRETLYAAGSVVTGVLGIALIWGGIDAGTADNLATILAGALNLIGAGAPATAAYKVNQQRKDGTLTASPTEQVIQGVQAVVEAKAKAEAEIERITDAVTGAIGAAPALGPLAQRAVDEFALGK